MDEIQTLTNEVKDLARRLGIVEDVLTNLVEEREAAGATAPIGGAGSAATGGAQASPASAPRSATGASASSGAAVPEWSPAQKAATRAAASERMHGFREGVLQEKMSSVNWLGAVSVICFVVAAAFIIKLAIETGWLTPARQIGLAALLGFTLIGAGLRLLKFDRAYASLLPGAGIVVLYLTAIAARSYHHLIGFEVALAAVALVSALCIWLYTETKHDVYPITSAIGAYLAPFLLGDGTQNDLILSYHVACSISFATISIWLDSRLLSVIAAYLAIGVSFFISSASTFDPSYISILLAHFTIFAFAVVIHSVKTGLPMTEKDAWAYFPVLLIFYASEYSLISKWNPAWAPSISLGFAAVLIALYFAGKSSLKKDSLASVNVVSAYAALVLFHSFYLELLDDTWKPWLLPVLVAAVALRPPMSKGNVSKTQVVPVIAVGAVIAIEYFRIAFALIDRKADTNMTAVSFAAPIALAFLFVQQRKARASQDLLPLLLAAHALAVLALYNIAEPFGSLAVSGSWLAYSVVIMGAGFSIRDKVVAKSALAALGLAAAKALLYDASMAPAPVRIACLLVTGLVLYGCGFLLKRIETWPENA